MPNRHSTINQHTVSIEVCHSVLNLVSLGRVEDDGPVQVHARTMQWRTKASSLQSETGGQELGAALTTLADEENLSGVPVKFCLSGDFCVTRILTGTNERVRREMAQLEHRSQRYLSLGPGHKAMAGSIRQIDARHQHALLTVSNRKTLEALMAGATAAGIQIDTVEPALVSLCRVVGRLGYDRDEPVLLVSTDEMGVELGISYDGQLLLDYRPGGLSVHKDMGEIISQHLARLQRYCFRYFRFAKGELKKVYLCGPQGHVERSLDSFDHEDRLQVDVIDVAQLDPQWELDDDARSGDMVAPLGSCLIDDQPADATRGPNLMEGIYTETAHGVLKETARMAAPMAAVLMLALVGLFVVFQQGTICRGLEQRLASYDAVKTKSLQLRAELKKTVTKTGHFQQLADHVSSPSWHELLGSIASCLPEGAWIDSVRLGGKRQIVIHGASIGQDTIYEFVGHLEQLPRLEDVALEGTTARHALVPGATGFKVQCMLANFNDWAEMKGKTDD